MFRNSEGFSFYFRGQNFCWLGNSRKKWNYSCCQCSWWFAWQCFSWQIGVSNFSSQRFQKGINRMCILWGNWLHWTGTNSRRKSPCPLPIRSFSILFSCHCLLDFQVENELLRSRDVCQIEKRSCQSKSRFWYPVNFLFQKAIWTLWWFSLQS